MAIVDEMYSEKDTLQTEIEVNTIGIEHAAGEKWFYGSSTNKLWNNKVLGEDLRTGIIAKRSPYDANLYVFLTGTEAGSGLGLGSVGSVCDPGRGRRASINRYAAGDYKGGDAYTAEVRIDFTLKYSFTELNLKGFYNA